MERMKPTRDLIWGVAISLLVHGAFLGLPFSPGGQRSVVSHQPIPLEISFIKLEVHEVTTPKAKPIAPTQPERVRQGVEVREKKVAKKREKSTTSLKEGETLTPAPEPFIPTPQAEITGNAPQQKEEGAKEVPLASPLPSAKDSLEGEAFNASLIPLILARPRYDRNPKPPYPMIARKRGYEGLVVLKVEILSNGRVGQVRVERSSGHRILDRSALKTVKEWRFIPAKRGEDPTRMWADIPIKFTLE